MSEKKEKERKNVPFFMRYLPPPERKDLPITITNQLWKPGAIEDTIRSTLVQPELDTLVAVAPFISVYFIKFLSATPLKNLILIINRDNFNPEYVKNAIEALKTAKFHVLVRERPPKSRFIHMKVMIPYKADTIPGTRKIVLTPYCIISGSVNFTRNGISVSDEILFIARDTINIRVVVDTYEILLKDTSLVYDSGMPARAP